MSEDYIVQYFSPFYIAWFLFRDDKREIKRFESKRHYLGNKLVYDIAESDWLELLHVRESLLLGDKSEESGINSGKDSKRDLWILN